MLKVIQYNQTTATHKGRPRTNTAKNAQALRDKSNRYRNNPKHAKKIFANTVHKKAKGRAERKGLEFTITIQDILNACTEYCPITGFRLDYTRGQGLKPFSPSIDRRDNNKGYTPENIHIVAHHGNTIKQVHPQSQIHYDYMCAA